MSAAEDKSNGWEDIAETFMLARNSRIGPAVVREWARKLTPGSTILDLGCGHGVPISQALIEKGFTVYGVDASEKMVAEFHKRFPDSPVECAAAEESSLFGRSFDAVVAWGLLFLLPPETQVAVISKAAAALKPGASFLFTAPAEKVTWEDSLTGRKSVSLGRDRYIEILESNGLALSCESSDEGENHYYFAVKSAAA
jgi:2-polyprenyl-3-methyl-5-hydroxy-6-metoxy-1,4-benzoquinol methylase